MTSYGKEILKDFISELKAYDPIIVSGLAYGVDISAHREAMNNNLDTIGILAHGLDRIYPGIHQADADNMIRNGGLLSEFWSGTRPEKVNFVKRNRIIAGISEATIVVESYLKGGSLITAELAQSYDRDVFAFPGRVSDQMSSGCNWLIKTNKASLISSARDLEYMLNWKEENKLSKNVQRELFVDLNQEEQVIFDHLRIKGKLPLDLLSLDCQITVSKTASVLLQLELKGMIRSFPGKEYEAIC